MATITALGFTIFSRYDGDGVRRARRDLSDMQGDLRRFANGMTQGERGMSRLGSQFMKLAGVIRLSILPAITQIVPVAAAGIGGLASMGTSAGAAFGVFALAVRGAFDRVGGFSSSVGNLAKELAQAKVKLDQMTPGTAHYEKQLKKVNELQDRYNHALKDATPGQRAFLNGMVALNTAYGKFINQTQERSLAFMTDGIKGLTAMVGKLGPTFDLVYPSMKRVSEAFRNWAEGAGFERFIGVVNKEGVPSLNHLLNAGKAVLTTLGIGFRTFAPLGTDMAAALEKGALAMQKWAEGGGFTRLLDSAAEKWPGVKEALINIAKALKNVWDGLSILGPISLKVAEGLAGIVAAIPAAVIAGLYARFVMMRGAMVLLMMPVTAIRAALGRGAGGGMVGAFTALRGVMGTLLPMFLKAAGLIGLFVTAVTLAWKYSGFFRDAVKGLWDAVKGLVTEHLAKLVVQFKELHASLEPVFRLLGQVIGLVLGVMVHAITLSVKFIGLLIDGLAKLMEGLNWLVAHMPAAWNALWGAIKTAALAVWGALQTAWSATVSGLSTAWQAVSGALTTAWNAVWSALGTAAHAVWTGLTTAWNAVVSGLTTAWTAVSGALVTAWNAVWSGLGTAAHAVWTGLTTAWNAVCSAFGTAWTAVSAALTTAWNAVWSALSTAAQAVWTALQTAWNAVCMAFSTAWTAVSAALTTAWNAVWTALSTAAQAVWTALQTAWQAVCTAFTTAWTAVSSALTTAWNAVWNALKTAADAVWEALKTAWSATLNFLKTTGDTILAALKTAWDTVWNAIKTAAQVVWDAMKVAWQAFLTAVQTIWTTVSTAVKTAWDTWWNAVKTAAQLIWDAMKVAWQAFLTAVQTIWTTVSTALKTAWDAVWNAMKTAATTIWDAIKGVWQGFLDALKTAWTTASGWLKDKWNELWESLKTSASTVWHNIGEVIEKAINGISGLINKLITGFNGIAKKVGIDLDIPTIPEVKLNFAVGGVVDEGVHLARGGVLGGYAPGRDTVPAMLSKGEGVLVPEAVRGLGGANFVHAANRHFSNGRGGKHVQGMSHFADGGVTGGGVGATQAWHRTGGGFWSFADGGSAGDDSGNPSSGVVGPGGVITGGESDTGSQRNNDEANTSPHAPGSGGLTGIGVIDSVLGFIGRAAIEAMFAPFEAMLGAWDNPAGDFGKMLLAMPKKILKGMIDKIVKEDEEAKKKYESMAVAGTQSVQAWRPLAIKAMQMGGIDPAQIEAFLMRMQIESSGNPNAINTWDINAKNGIPSQGLMQIIPPNFTKYHVAGTSNNILDPLANMAAAAAYIRAVYGGKVPTGAAYALGTSGATSGTHLVGEKGPELVNFSGGQTVTPAKQTAGILGGMGGGGVDIGSMIQGGDPDELIAQLQAIVEAARKMQTSVQASWSGVVTSGQTAKSALTPVIADVITQHGTNIPTALNTMATANTTAWTTMGTQSAATWTAMKAGTFTQAQQTMMTDMPLWMTTMGLANSTKWTEMQTATDTTWAAMRDGTFLEANDHMSVKMPEWGNSMNTAVSQAWTNMGDATATAWEGMKEGTREPTNWIIENSYNNGIRNLWNQVAGVIFDDGAKDLPSVATLATGGPVRGPGTGTSDSVPARLSAGEHVWTAREVAAAGGHHAVARMRAGVKEGVPGFALGGWLGGGVSGSSPSVGTLDLKRGSMADTVNPILDDISSSARGALAGSMYRQAGAIADVLSPADWIKQYVEKDDELNKIGSGGPPWVDGVSDVHTTWGGVAVNQRTADMLDAAVGLGAHISAVQGSFSTGVAASAGTHDGGGVVDLVPTGNDNVGFLRAVGFAAWNRGASWGSPSFDDHIHAVALGDPTVSAAAAAQIQSYLAGGNGLADGGPDNFSGGIPAAAGAGVAGGGKNVDPADLTQGVMSFDSGGYLPPGYTVAFNGTRKPEPVGHDLVPRGSQGMGDVHFEINVSGNADADKIVTALKTEAIPQLRTLITKGTGKHN